MLFAAVSWISNSSGDFDTPTNWSTGKIPGAADDVTINAPAGTIIDKSSGSTDTIHSLNNSNTLQLSGGILSVTNGVTLFGDLILSGGTLSDASVTNTTSHLQLNAGIGTLDGVKLDGDASIVAGSSISIGSKGINLAGHTLHVVGDSNLPATVTFQGSQTLTSGVVSMEPFSTFDATGTFTVGAAASISASSSTTILGTTLINKGTISVTGAANSLTVSTQNLTNNGTIAALAGATLQLFTVFSSSGIISGANNAMVVIGAGTSWSNTGTISMTNGGILDLAGTVKTADLGTIQGAGATVNLTAQVDNTSATFTLNNTTGAWNLAGGTITGGSLTFAGQSLIFDGGTLDGVTLNQDITVPAGGILVVGTNGINLGTHILHVVGDQKSQSVAVVTLSAQTFSSGTISLEGDGTTEVVAQGTITLGKDAILQSTGPAGVFAGDGSFVNQGTVAVVGAGSVLALTVTTLDNQGTVKVGTGATIQAVGDFTFSGANDVEVGPSGAGQFVVGGAATFGGTLNISLAPGFVPANGSSFNVITYVSTQGAFASVTGLSQAGVTFAFSNGANALSISSASAVVLADLTLTGATYTAGTYKPGDSFTFTATEQNIGAATSGIYSARVVLSLDTVFGNSDDVLLQSITEPALAAGVSHVWTAATVIPAVALAGSYFVLAEIDASAQVTESNEANNDFAGKTADVVVTPAIPVTFPPAAKVGGLDPTFGNSGLAGHDIGIISTSDLTVQPDGKSVIAGVGGSTGSGVFAVTRYNTDGSLDTSFGSNGVVNTSFGGDDRAAAVAVLPSGAILVVGTSTTDAGSQFALVQYTSTGALDSSFGGGTGMVLTSFSSTFPSLSTDVAHTLVVGPTGEIFVGGSSNAAGTGLDFAIAAYNPDGSLATSFNGTGKVLLDLTGGDESIASLALQRNGQLVAVGTATPLGGGASSVAAARFFQTGAVDTKFGDQGHIILSVRGVADAATSVALDSKDRIIIGGYSAAGSAEAGTLSVDFLLLRYLKTGKPDRSFGGAGVIIMSFGQPAAISRVIITTGDSIIASGKTTASLSSLVPSQLDVAIARYTDKTKGQTDPTFNGNGRTILSLNDDSAPSLTQSLVPLSIVPFDTTTDLMSAFTDFTGSSQGVVAVTQGGGLLSSGNSGSDTVVASIVTDGVDLLAGLIAPLPPSIISGAKGSATFQVTEIGTSLAAGNATISLFVSAVPQFNVGDAAFQSFPEKLKLKQTKGKPFKLKFLFPSTVPDGNYFLLASIDLPGQRDLDLSNNGAISVGSVRIAQAFVDLTGSTFVLPRIVASKPFTVALPVANHGNSLAGNSSAVAFLASPDGTLGSAVPLATVHVKLKIKASGAGVVKAKTSIPSTLPTGTYFLLATVDPDDLLHDPNHLDNTLVSAATFTVP